MRHLFMILGVMALCSVYLLLIALGQIEMHTRTSGVGEALFAILFLALIVYVAVKARQVDFTKPTMVIGPDGIAGQRLPKLIPWQMIERVDIPEARWAGFIYLTVRKEADPEILEVLRKRQPLERTVAIPHRWVPGFRSSEVKDVVNRYFERSRQR
ncbi:transmembrane protein [Rhizobium leguminosarum bv. phaseoli CCGM1]|nr:transmembrane protein [Rhizobium leguminosarum bv. phaseoli CCGM1]